MAITLKKTNFAKGTLVSNIAIDANSLSLQTGEGAKFPQTGNFRAVLWSASYAAPESDANREIVEATLTSGDTFSITRAKEGTTAKAWSANDNFALVFTKETLDEIETEINTKASLTGAETLTNKRINPRIYSTSSASSLTPEIDTYDIFEFTALAENLTINNYSSSTPVNGEMMMFIIKDNGTSRTISWGNKYASGDVTLPTATTAGKWLYIGLKYNSTADKWHCLAVGNNY